jgi:hypothetical protein
MQRTNGRRGAELSCGEAGWCLGRRRSVALVDEFLGEGAAEHSVVNRTLRVPPRVTDDETGQIVERTEGVTASQ